MIISRYLAREVLNTLLAVTLVLVLAFLSQQVVRYLNYVAIGKIATSVVIKMIIFQIPFLLALLLPLGLYLGILLAYGRLYADSEMAILQMCGYSRKRIVKLTLIIAVPVALLVLYLMLWINPLISAKRQQLLVGGEATAHLVQTLIPGRFQSTSDGQQVIYVENLSRDHQHAENVFIAHKVKQQNPDALPTWTVVLANQGYQTQDKASGDSFFVTLDGYRYEGTPGQNNYTITHYKKYAIRALKVEAHGGQQEEEATPVGTLIKHYADPKSAAELQWRFSIAISALMLALLAVPTSAVSPRQGRYVTLLPAIIIYIAYIYLLFMARHFVEQGSVSVNIGMWWVHGLFLLLILAVYRLNKK